jgi:3-hydroxybutyryl-CoA dehydratase
MRKVPKTAVELNYSEIEIGQVVKFTTTITAEKVAKFIDITADYSPIHVDDEYAQKRGYLQKVAHGMLTASYISTLAGMYLPGKNCILLTTSVQFSSPVYAEDELEITGTVTEKNDALKVLKVQVDVKNQDDKKVLRGSFLAKVTDDEEQEVK